MPRLPINIISPEIKNVIINSNFDFWQRNTSFSIATGGAYTADRFKYGRDGSGDTGTISRQIFTPGQTDVPGNPTYFLRHNQTVAGTGTTVRAMENRIEDVSTFAGKQATISFYAKADTSRTFSMNLFQNFGSGGSSSVSVANQSVTLTTVWQKFNITFNVPSISGKTVGAGSFISLQMFFPNNAVHTIDLAQLMFNEGNSPSNHKLAGEELAGELQLCQRYYNRTEAIAICDQTNGNIRAIFANFPVRMRTNAVVNSLGNFTQVNGGGGDFSFSGQNVSSNALYGAVNIGGGISGRVYNGSIEADAEL